MPRPAEKKPFWSAARVTGVLLCLLGGAFYLLPRELGSARDRFFGRMLSRSRPSGSLAEGIGPARSRIPNESFRVPAQAYFRAPAKKKECPSWNGIPDLACLHPEPAKELPVQAIENR